MISWFKDRLKNQRPWFRYATGLDLVEGTKVREGLILAIRNEGVWKTVFVDRESAERMREWFNRCYPSGGADVVQLSAKIPKPQQILRLAKQLPVPGTAGDTGPGPSTPAG